jgi:putative tryptophan/tyrosine transport system substrate-binding protein
VGAQRALAETAAIRLKVDVIVTSATPPTVAAKQATSVIPIVFAAVGDPVGAGVVEPLARPGGNATGLSVQQTDTAGNASNSGCGPHGRTGQASRCWV